MAVRKISVSEFKARCFGEIREVEKGDLVLELTRNGKTVAVIQQPSGVSSASCLKDWVGSGGGTVTFAPGYDPAAPAFDPEDWES